MKKFIIYYVELDSFESFKTINLARDWQNNEGFDNIEDAKKWLLENKKNQSLIFDAQERKVVALV